MVVLSKRPGAQLTGIITREILDKEAEVLVEGTPTPLTNLDGMKDPILTHESFVEGCRKIREQLTYFPPPGFFHPSTYRHSWDSADGLWLKQLPDYLVDHLDAMEKRYKPATPLTVVSRMCRRDG